MSSNNPLVTVAVPAYNVEKFLEKGMKSVLAQTYKNLEIILVDDGSTDSSAVICDKLAAEQENIRVIHKENGGPGSARNAGLDAAQGKYIYFFDVDDTISPQLIAYNVEMAEKYQTQLNIFSFNVRVDGENQNEDILMKEHLLESNDDLREIYCEELLFTKHGNGFVWNKFYLLSFLKQNGIRFGNQRIQQDELFNMQLYPILDRVYISSEVLYNYVIYRSGNVGSRYLPDKYKVAINIFHRFISFYQTWKLDDEKVLSYIYNRFEGTLVNAMTYNLEHPDNPQTNTEKVNSLRMIMDDPDVQNLVSYRECNGKLSIYLKFVKNRQPRMLRVYYEVRTGMAAVKHRVFKGN